MAGEHPDDGGGTTAYVGFTAGTGGLSATQQVLNWTYSTGSGTTPPPVPTNVVASAGNGQVGLSWSASSGATSYNVGRSTTSGGPYTTIASPTATTYTDTAVSNGTTYYYVVAAVNSAGTSANSSQVSATPQLAVPPVPTNVVASAGNGQVGLSWSASSGATSYNVGRSTTSGGPYTTIASPTATTYTDTAVTNGTTYYYVVAAVNSAGTSANSSQVSATPQLAVPPVPTNVVASAGNGQVGLSWSASSGATSYNVGRSTTSGGPYTTIASPTATTYTDTAVTNGTTYYYVVAAVNSAGTSANSSQVSATPQLAVPPVPTNVVASAGNGQVGLSWSASSGATSYNVGRSTTSGGPYTTIGSPTATTYTDTAVSNGTTYYYVVAAVNGAGTSANSSQVSATPQLAVPPVPTNVVASAGNGQVGLSWSASSGATSYNVGRSTTSGGPYTTIGSPTATTYTDTAVSNGTTYYYVVAAVNGAGTSANSSQVSATPATITTVINYGGGFTSSGLQLNGNAMLNGANLELTNGGEYEASSAYYTTAVNVQSFTTAFSIQLTNANADGMAFVIQNAAATALGADGGALGYQGIGNSVAVKFDIYNNAGEGTDSTGLYTDGAMPTVPAVDMTSSGVSLVSGDVMNVQLSYNGSTLTMTITDASTLKSFTTSWPVNIPTTVGSTTAYVGFTAGTGGLSATQQVLNWTYSTGSGTTPPPVPTNVVASAGNGQVGLSWSASSGATSYNVGRSTTSGGPYTTIASPTATTYTDTAVSNGTTYYYVVAAVNGAGTSANSSQVSATPQLAVPPVPTNVVASAGNGQVGLSWSASSGATSYNVGRSTTSGGPYTTIASPTATTYTDTAVSNGTTYYYVVAAVNGAGTSANSSQVSATPATITTVINYGGGFTSSGLQLNGNAALNGANLELTNGGAYEASSAYYTTAVNVQSFTTAFSMQLTNANADGMAFVIQNTAATALGADGGALGDGRESARAWR